MIIAKVLDGVGLYGELLHFIIALVSFGTAVLIFIYLWRKGRLDMDEGPAERMLHDEPEEKEEEEKNGK
jgi:nitrogen fixation-related uncharacterized protein